MKCHLERPKLRMYAWLVKGSSFTELRQVVFLLILGYDQSFIMILYEIFRMNYYFFGSICCNDFLII